VNGVHYFNFPGVDGRAPRCGISLGSAGAMKPKRDDANRSRFFRGAGIDPGSVVSVSQIHSRIVRVAESAAPFADYPEGDGVITGNRDLVPCVTVADCMPIFVFDPESGCFGALHSGWRGTGIVRTALELAADEWNAKPENFSVVLGPHIRSCCYTVDAERAGHFTKNYGPSCVSEDANRIAEGSQWPFRLSLAEANRLLCLELGVREDRILDVGSCTACGSEYGSNRREGADAFTHMAAFVSWH
jgi:YfiH family protein